MSKNAQDAVIVSTARTPIGKAYRGAFNDTEAPVLGGHVIRAALDKAGVQGHEVDDVILGIAAQQGTQGYNLGRLCCYTAGLPESVGGITVNRFCASGLSAVAMAATAPSSEIAGCAATGTLFNGTGVSAMGRSMHQPGRPSARRQPYQRPSRSPQTPMVPAHRPAATGNNHGKESPAMPGTDAAMRSSAAACRHQNSDQAMRSATSARPL